MQTALSLPEKKTMIKFVGNTFIKYLINAFVIFFVFAKIVSFDPNLPGVGLDFSWMIGINQAMAQGLAVGKDIIFTFGPFASLYTKLYHPHLDSLLFFGSLCFAVCYVIAFMLLACNQNWKYVLFFCFFIVNLQLDDSLYFSYPLLLCLLVYRSLCLNEPCEMKIYQKYLLVFLFIPLSILTLIKGTFLLFCFAVLLLCSLLFFLKKEYFLLFGANVSVFSLLIFWLLSNQSLQNLPTFFLNIAPIISGYGEAMMLEGPLREVILYMVASSAILYLLLNEKTKSQWDKKFLIAVTLIFLFINFKAGFVRHDAHAMIAICSLVIAITLLKFVVQSSKFKYVFFICICAWFCFDKNYFNTSTGTIYSKLKTTSLAPLKGLHKRFISSNNLAKRYTESLESISKKFPITAMKGSTDIYSYNQAYLLASQNIWSPRPVFQSYSAYTPYLSYLNENHLKSEAAPDNIIFKIEPIDGRLPSLEDGSSWPNIFNGYSTVDYDPLLDLIYLTKKKHIEKIENKVFFERTYQLGEKIEIPDLDGMIFADVQLDLSFIGKIRAFLYKPSPLRIRVTLPNGDELSYRFISLMGKSKFLISPLVENTRDFFDLHPDKKVMNFSKKKVKQIIIESTYGDHSWEPSFSLKLSTLRPEDQ